MIAEARHNLVKHPNDINPTQDMLNQWRTEQPGMDEIELLQGELLLAYEKPEAARPILEELTQRPKLPLWVAQQAKELLSQIP